MNGRLLGLATILLILPAAAGPSPDDARRIAIRKSVAFLDQNLFGLVESAGTPRKPFTYAVAGLVYLMNEPRTGRDSPIPRIKDYLLDYLEEVERRSRDPEELPRQHGVATSWNLIQYTWPTAVAGLFFAELHERGQYRKESRDALRRIVTVLEEAQQANGGWGHGRASTLTGPDSRNPFADRMPAFKSTYPDTLVSSSFCVAATIGIAGALLGRDAVPSAPDAREYFRTAQLPFGNFPYDPSQRSSGQSDTSVGRTAGAIYAMHCLGMPRNRGFKRATEYVLTNLPKIPEGHGSPCLNMMYGALASHALGPKIFKRFRNEFHPRLIEAQSEDGALPCICHGTGFAVTCDSKLPISVEFLQRGQKVYTTALHAFVLLLDAKRLKILDQTLPRAATTKR
jgi:hypothetical protein